MLAKYIFILASAVSVIALPNWAPTTTSSVAKVTTTSALKPTTSATKPTTTAKASTTKATTSASPTSTPINNGNQFTNQCVNVGISIADCTDLLSIAALNGNTIIVGGSGSGSGSTTPVNNGQQFLDQCANFGISVLDCAELINLALLNGNTIEIDLASLISALNSLGLPGGLLAGLLGTVNGLITPPGNLL